MTTLTGTRRGFAAFGSAFLLASLLTALTACRIDGEAAAVNHAEVKWAERQLLVIGDRRTGTARVFHMRAAPLLIGELRAPGRQEVRDIRIDPQRNRIWVLGESTLDLHDGSSWSLIRRIGAPAASASGLRLDGTGSPLLLGSGGRAIARVDAQHLTVEWLRLAENAH